MAASAPPANQAPPGMASAMLPMFGMMLLMMVIYSVDGLRIGIGNAAGTVIEPLLPFHESLFVPTVFILGSSIMVVNTIVRHLFMDPLKQAHNSHRSGQIRKQMQDARLSRDTARIEKMERLQFEMMPEQFEMQGAIMKPMMYTIVFIMGIFTWMGTSVETFRVEYVSLPWAPMWGLETRVMWIFPAWIATYITMSAPLGRIVDRHLKLLRYRYHPVILAGDSIPEPLLHLIADERVRGDSERRMRQAQRRRAGPRKTGDANSQKRGGNKHAAPPKAGSTCSSCDGTDVSRTKGGKLRCRICRNEWR